MRSALLALLLVSVPALAADADSYGPVEKVLSGFKFTEGPAADRNGNLYFTDSPNYRIHKLDAAGKLSTFREKSEGANGLMLNAQGEIVTCETDTGCVVAISVDGKNRRVIAGEYNGKRFNAANDLVIDRTGGLWFTDPLFGKRTKHQDVFGVYYVDPKGTVTRAIADLPLPNGILMSPDEKTLYVVPTGQAEMMSYPIESPGKIGAGKVFCVLKQPEGRKNSGGDGLAVDTEGNVYITSDLGLQVFSQAGKPITIITIPEIPANVKFGGKDLSTLYVTARTSLYAIKTKKTGHLFALPK